MSEDNKTLNEIVSVLISERKRDYRNKIIFRIFVFVAFISLLIIALHRSTLHSIVIALLRTALALLSIALALLRTALGLLSIL